MSYRMIQAARRLMCDKFSVLCTLAELNEKQLREDDSMNINERIKRISDYEAGKPARRLAVKIKQLHPDAVIPKYAHDYDAGVDLVATEDVIVEPGETVKVPTGIAVSIPAGYEAQIRPRSGITLKTKLRVQLGTIDAGYNGELGVVVDNIAHDSSWGVGIYLKVDGEPSDVGYEGSSQTYLIRKGDRIAQLVIAPIEQAQFIEVDTLEETQRGEGGFGSSGVK